MRKWNKVYRRVCSKCGRIFYIKYKVTNLCKKCRDEQYVQLRFKRVGE